MKLNIKVVLLFTIHIIYLGYSNLGFGQCSYQALLSYEKEDKTLAEQINSSFANDLNRIKNYPKNIHSELSDFLKSRKTYIEEINKNSLIISDSIFISYYQGILDTILKANPYLDQNIKIYITRFLEPNAFNTGDGNIYLNISIIRFLQNESQLAFIIAHELAHQHKEHVLESNIKTTLLIKSKEMQAQIKKASKQEYGSKTALKEIAKSLVFSSNKHSRFKESEADSLALVFLSKTKYNITDAISTLTLLEEINSYFEEFPHFVFTEYFNRIPITKRHEWNNYDVDTTFVSAIDKEEKANDSLKTHPDCSQRKQFLESNFSNLIQTTTKNNNPETEFNDKRKKATIEYLNSIMLYKDYGFCFNELIYLLKKDSLDCTLKLILSRTFAEINYAQRTRTLGEVLLIPSFVYPIEYNYSLSFLNELKSIETGAISYFLLKEIHEDIGNEDYLYTSILTNYAYNKKEEADRLAKLYLKEFQNGKYISFIKTINFN